MNQSFQQNVFYLPLGGVELHYWPLFWNEGWVRTLLWRCASLIQSRDVANNLQVELTVPNSKSIRDVCLHFQFESVSRDSTFSSSEHMIGNWFNVCLHLFTHTFLWWASISFLFVGCKIMKMRVKCFRFSSRMWQSENFYCSSQNRPSRIRFLCFFFFFFSLLIIVTVWMGMKFNSPLNLLMRKVDLVSSICDAHVLFS